MSGAVDMVEANPKLFTQEFRVWLPKNLHIWDAFVQESTRVIDRGFQHYSARTIIHVLRHHSALVENGTGEWKISNNTSPYLSRLFGLMYPAHKDLFSNKRTPSLEREREGIECFEGEEDAA